MDQDDVEIKRCRSKNKEEDLFLNSIFNVPRSSMFSKVKFLFRTFENVNWSEKNLTIQVSRFELKIYQNLWLKVDLKRRGKHLMLHFFGICSNQNGWKRKTWNVSKVLNCFKSFYPFNKTQIM